jgi:hypothetical protein
VAQGAFEKLKMAMISQPILYHFDPTYPLTLETDALDYAIGAVCSQPDDEGTLYLLGYFLRKLKNAERNYDIHDKELLAIMDSLQKWSTYCRSMQHPITILSDYKNLEYWQTKKDLNLHQAWWGELLANYNFRIIYRPGKLARKLDILSCKLRDSPWEGEVKHSQNKGRMLLPEQTFVTNAAEIITVENDAELLREIKNKMKTDLEIQDILRKLKKRE